MIRVRKIAVGSRNPVKVGAVKEGLRKLFPKADYVGVEVGSGVSHQPRSDEETMKGARNRAKRALKQGRADIGVGLEGGVIETSEGLMNTNWCFLVTKDGVESHSGGSHFLLPEKFARKVRKGKELADILDELMEEKDIRSKQGVIGLLTKNLLTRKDEYTHLVKMATVKLQSKDLYNS